MPYFPGYREMSDEVYQALAQASSGFVESPAGCGKTEAIIRTVGTYCNGRQLILTHTHAGVDALRQRFRQHSISTVKYHVDTISGWAWGWVRKYPENAGYTGSTEIAQWKDVYAAMSVLLQKDFVKRGVTNSYAGIIVDEYQDCTVPMHQLIVQLKTLLPCRVLGDDLQGIFGFNDPLVDWAVATAEFANNLGALETPHRWIKAGNEALGRWLLNTRSKFRHEQEPDYGGSPIDRCTVGYTALGPQLVHLTHEKHGRVCVIGPKARPLPAGIETTLVNKNYRVLEPNPSSAVADLRMSNYSWL
jgi:DNA helicase-2/ATP-dependent DNA helicase PcrA